MANHKVYEAIIRAVNQGRLTEPFSADDFRKACPGFKANTYRNFLSKHEKNNPSGTSELFKRTEIGKYKLLQPFRYGL